MISTSTLAQSGFNSELIRDSIAIACALRPQVRAEKNNSSWLFSHLKLVEVRTGYQHTVGMVLNTLRLNW